MSNKNNTESKKSKDMRISVRLRTLGRSLGITIPKDIIDFFEASEDDLIEIEIIEVHKKKEDK